MGGLSGLGALVGNAEGREGAEQEPQRGGGPFMLIFVLC